MKNVTRRKKLYFLMYTFREGADGVYFNSKTKYC